ncbi:MAG: NIPSNAP family protein [Polaromonas sp.]|nr:NIPSNAP family protein [Polaromonas sp.]
MPTLYEKRTYSVVVGQMAEVIRLYSTLGWPAMEAGGFSKNLIGYFTSDTGELHQLVHLWRFESDDARREFWKKLFADPDFMGFAKQLRPLLKSQSNQLLLAAPWGPQP